MRTKHYLKAFVATMAVVISLPVCGQSFRTDKELKPFTPVLSNSKMQFGFANPENVDYQVHPNGQFITYSRKSPDAIKKAEEQSSGTVKLTIITKYNHDTEGYPGVFMYHSKNLDTYSSLNADWQSDDGDTVTMTVPADTFDILSHTDILTGERGTSYDIHEQVALVHDTTIVFDHEKEVSKFPIVAYDENGEKFAPDYVRWTSRSPYYETIKAGNTENEGILQINVFLNGYGNTYGIGFGLIGSADSTNLSEGRLRYVNINKLSDRYSVVARAHLVKKNGEHYAIRMRLDSVSGEIKNDISDYTTAEEIFRTTPLGESSESHSWGIVIKEISDQLNYNYLNDKTVYESGTITAYRSIMDFPIPADNKLKVHLCAPMESGLRTNAADLALNFAYGDIANKVTETNYYQDENGRWYPKEDTLTTYKYNIGETFIEKNGKTEYISSGHDYCGAEGTDYRTSYFYVNLSLLYNPGASETSNYLSGHRVFSSSPEKRSAANFNSSPMLSLVSRNYIDPESQNKDFFWDICYLGRNGEIRMTDNIYPKLKAEYNDSIVYEADTLYNEKFVDFTNDWQSANHPDGKWKLTLTDNNVMVDSIAGHNYATITYDQSKDDWTPPTLQMLNFINADSTITDRFASPSEGTLQFAGGDFNYIIDAETYFGYFDCQPMTVKVEYSPYNEDKWADFDVEEDPSLYTMPAFGYFYRGQLSQVKGNSSNGWFDLRFTLTDESGNIQQQVISPAFKIESLTAISSVNADNARTTDGRIYDLQGRAVTHPAHGIYIKDGKKFVVK